MQATNATNPLTTRELQCLAHVAEGLGARDIGERLGITQRTVETHIANAMRKLNTRNRASTVVQAMRLGLIH